MCVYPREFMTLRVAQFSLKIAHLSFSMVLRGPRACGLRPRLWLLVAGKYVQRTSLQFAPLSATNSKDEFHVYTTPARAELLICSRHFPLVINKFTPTSRESRVLNYTMKYLKTNRPSSPLGFIVPISSKVFGHKIDLFFFFPK